MRRLWYPEEVRDLDSRAIRELGLPGIALMECAGAEAARVVSERYGPRARVSVLCGPGNNGGDGFVVARHLHVAGVAAGVCTDAAAQSTTPDASTMRAAAAAFGVPERAPEDADVIIDALFGSGFRGKLEGDAEALVTRANALASQVVALDVPSGVDGASGRVEGAAIRAVLTLAFHGRTLGTAIEPGRGCSGEVVELPIGLPIALAGPQRAVRMERSDLALVPAALADRVEVRRGRCARRRWLTRHERGSGTRCAGGLPGRRGGGVGVRPGERARGRGGAFPGAHGARRARSGASARARGARAGRRRRARPGTHARDAARSSTPWCAASRRRSCWMRMRSTRSPSGWRRWPSAPGRRR